MTPDTPHQPLAIVEVFRFAARRAPVVFGLCLIAACGRAVQTGVPLLAAWPFQILFELLVNGARVALALAALGDGSPREGWQRVRRLLAMPQEHRTTRINRAFAALRTHLGSLLADIGLYLLFALAVNLAITFIVHQPATQAWAAAQGLATTGETPLALFLKNLSVIPGTILFQVFLARRLWRWGA